MLERFSQLTRRYDPTTGELDADEGVERRLSDLRGMFADGDAFEAALAEGDPVVYRVGAVATGDDSGDLHYGVGALYPGRIGNEYFFTKGHLHTRREAAEVYVGFRGEGGMLLEDEATGETRFEPLGAGRVVYVPGHTAHRTVNTGAEPLVYIGVFPADAGHDYGAIGERNFLRIVVEENGEPVMRERPSP